MHVYGAGCDWSFAYGVAPDPPLTGPERSLKLITELRSQWSTWAFAGKNLERGKSRSPPVGMKPNST